ncbi:hypothetical protein [Candidatus Enterococcus ferrettii]|uniref:CPBP family intramembrane metalloprotease n=1 Tax=Candidatus Enterococcus ferrettii TaxID=2815324 RepID=A0ABV0EN54_9ENTE
MFKEKSLSTRYPVLFSVILVLIVLVVTSIDTDQNVLGGKDFAVSRIVVILGLLLLIKDKGFFSVNDRRGQAFFATLLWGSPLVLIGVGSALLTNGASFSEQTFPAFSDSVVFMLNMFLVGAVEELLYRGVVFNCLYETFEAKNGRPPVNRTMKYLKI